MQSHELKLARHPQGKVRPSDFHLDVVTVLEELAPGDILVRNSWSSIDPSVRMRLGPTGPAGYLPPFRIGETLTGLAVGEVLESRDPGFEKGDTVLHIKGFRELAVVRPGSETLAGAGGVTRLDTSVYPPQSYLGALGSSGLTAYVGLQCIGGLTSGDVVWISSAAGAVGSLAAQIAKLRGHYVVGSTGSGEKVRFLLDELKLDAAFDYHSPDLAGALASAAPDGIDLYFDNVGGAHLEAALYHLRPGGRVAMAGAVASYDADTAAPSPGNLFQIVAKNLTVQGFRAGAYDHLLGDMRAEVGSYLRDGRLVVEETVFDGLGSAPDAIVAMLHGRTVGKTLCRLR
ncbi:NADP-dependent oxidoreductase [Rhodococcus opacus]|uniref:NADP-dependent oxidoreductase n=1 Tax=Rhodococcus opacus TaxID=37919 RepID=A0A2S8JI19_RHOOP|nr:NADP-dependent oxidoreductase [Rhodococcus opacus]PQP26569.1 NADP-dependent oxidoreductase [Rhodococcus opacus]